MMKPGMIFHPNSTHKLDNLYGKKVAVLGFARQGKSLARWLPTIGARVVVSDSRPYEKLASELTAFPDVEFILGAHPESLLDGVDLLCISGGVSPDLPIVQEAVKRRIPLSNDAELFMERSPAPVIGITGSAGKTTTTTLTGEILKRAGMTTWVGGNIGDVLLDVLPQIKKDDVVVMELSSFQLELMTTSPRLGTILNITPNHLDRHGTMENYIRAKANMIAHQGRTDTAVLGYDDGVSRSLAEIVAGHLVWFSGQSMVSDGAFMAGQRLLVVGRSSVNGEPKIVCEQKDIPLRGDHNVMNVLAACAITGAAGVTADVMEATIRDFKPVPHRLEVVRVVNDVTYINDSIATAPERVLAALRSFKEPLVLLAGGKDKNLPWEEMIRLALTKCRHIVAFGDAADLVVSVVTQVAGNADAVTRVSTLDEAVAQAAKRAQPGDIVLLSPGGTSYDAYIDFVARGEHFRQLVMGL
ncbi:MAG: UDP-N-acetylmuramoyl-L-alanine--D-glutamate ligase [Chloroflexi bacterium]|nr:UDP-N-acetylmuramoyl-L-alanine--D-glutamate ligase [Chloroflexota bacterium]MCC6896682.1 UDP-N-acetylmuramoyl-L-alanine--D-glutamate ligase [Anaerolineae bacterium]